MGPQRDYLRMLRAFLKTLQPEGQAQTRQAGSGCSARP